MAASPSSTAMGAGVPVRSANRKWGVYAASALVAMIGAIFVYRAVSGNTTKETREAARIEAAAKELANKSSGSPEAFSVRLANRRKELDEEAAKSAVQAAKDSAAFGREMPKLPPPSGRSDPDAGTSKISQGSGVANTMAKARRINDGELPSGQPNGSLGDADGDPYAALKELQAKDLSRKMNAWEAGQGSLQAVAGAATTSGQSTNPLLAAYQAQLAAAGVAGNTGTAGTGNSGGSPAAPLIEALLRSQSAQNQNQAQPVALPSADGRFLQSTADASGKRAQLPLLMAREGRGRYRVLEGSQIEVVMRTKVSSDVAGPCRAQVVRDVYDSLNQSTLLIPAGSWLVCAYDAQVVQGQEVLPIAFTRLVLPNGSDVALADMQGADSQGAIGAPAQVNTRFWKTFGSSLLIAVVSRMAERKADTGVTVNVAGSSGSSNIAASVFAEVAKKSLERNLNIKPELVLNLGDRLNLVVSRDMELDPAITQRRQ